MKSPICGALIRWREGVSTLEGGRPLLDITAVTGQAFQACPTLPLTRPLAKTPPELALVHYTLDKPPAELHNSGFFSKCVKSLIIICLNCINNPHGFNRIFLSRQQSMKCDIFTMSSWEISHLCPWLSAGWRPPLCLLPPSPLLHTILGPLNGTPATPTF